MMAPPSVLGNLGIGPALLHQIGRPVAAFFILSA
jgi:hypothetical protein